MPFAGQYLLHSQSNSQFLHLSLYVRFTCFFFFYVMGIEIRAPHGLGQVFHH